MRDMTTRQLARHKTDRPAGCTVLITSGLDQFRKRHVFLPQSDNKTGAAQLFPSRRV